MNTKSKVSADVHGPARIGIGGPVGSGKTALLEALIPPLLEAGIELAVITNDLVTHEDAERVRRVRAGAVRRARVGGRWPCAVELGELGGAQRGG